MFAACSPRGSRLCHRRSWRLSHLRGHCLLRPDEVTTAEGSCVHRGGGLQSVSSWDTHACAHEGGPAVQKASDGKQRSTCRRLARHSGRRPQVHKNLPSRSLPHQHGWKCCYCSLCQLIISQPSSSLLTEQHELSEMTLDSGGEISQFEVSCYCSQLERSWAPLILV